MDYDNLRLSMIMHPEGLEAIQNSFVAPVEYIHYSEAILAIEQQAFPNFLTKDRYRLLRQHLDYERVFDYSNYIHLCNQDTALKRAELERSRAKVSLHDAIYLGYVNSFILKFDKNKKHCDEPNKLLQNWWRGDNYLNIDGLGYLWAKGKEKSITEGIILLERKGLNKWGDAHPEYPKKAGRTKGTGKISDEESLDFMKSLVVDGSSALQAAQKATEKYGTKGASEEAHIKRLTRKYRENN